MKNINSLALRSAKKAIEFIKKLDPKNEKEIRYWSSAKLGSVPDDANSVITAAIIWSWIETDSCPVEEQIVALWDAATEAARGKPGAGMNGRNFYADRMRRLWDAAVDPFGEHNDREYCAIANRTLAAIEEEENARQKLADLEIQLQIAKSKLQEAENKSKEATKNWMRQEYRQEIDQCASITEDCRYYAQDELDEETYYKVNDLYCINEKLVDAAKKEHDEEKLREMSAAAEENMKTAQVLCHQNED